MSPGCSSGKRIYGNEKVADRAIEKAVSRGECRPLRWYECEECGHLHLTTDYDLVCKVPHNHYAAALGQQRRGLSEDAD